MSGIPPSLFTCNYLSINSIVKIVAIVQGITRAKNPSEPDKAKAKTTVIVIDSDPINGT